MTDSWHDCLSGALAAYEDDGTPKYLNHYAFTVSADTKGTWVVSLDPQTLYTQLNAPDGPAILPLARNPALITVELGQCCYNIGAEAIECTDGVTQCDCEALSGVFFPGEQCDWVAGYPYGCDVCVEDSDCDDDNACTIDDCCTQDEWDEGLCETVGACHRTDVTPEGYCCDPQSGPVRIDDQDPCTDDWCDEEAGVVHHDVLAFCVMPVGCRYITARAPNGEDVVALLVVGDAQDPAVSCVSLYMQADGTLGETAYFQTPAEWLGIYAHGEEIIPATTYGVSLDDGTTVSDPIEATTFDWADVDHDGYFSLTDIMFIILAFQHDFSQVSLQAVDLAPCMPDALVSLDDIMAAIRRYQHGEYTDTCDPPCR